LRAACSAGRVISVRGTPIPTAQPNCSLWLKAREHGDTVERYALDDPFRQLHQRVVEARSRALTDEAIAIGNTCDNRASAVEDRGNPVRGRLLLTQDPAEILEIGIHRQDVLDLPVIAENRNVDRDDKAPIRPDLEKVRYFRPASLEDLPGEFHVRARRERRAGWQTHIQQFLAVAANDQDIRARELLTDHGFGAVAEAVELASS
jgi:hypothetical protein